VRIAQILHGSKVTADAQKVRRVCGGNDFEGAEKNRAKKISDVFLGNFFSG